MTLYIYLRVRKKSSFRLAKLYLEKEKGFDLKNPPENKHHVSLPFLSGAC
jgi:hypothetical protein